MERQRTTALPAEAELVRQMEYIREIRQENDRYFAETGKHKKFYSLAMGCQMNAHDSEKLEGMLDEMGYERTQEETEADFIIYNTCCVRENAELKVYGKLGWLKHYKKENPDAVVALCGCMMQQDTVLETIRQKYRHVDLVFGTFNLYKLPELMKTREESGCTVFDIWQENQEVVEDLPSIRHFPYKASVNIMFGCNNFCSYCIVPYVRGRERSRTPEDILAEVRKLAADGVKEVMLLGQNVNSYGKNLENPVSFAELLRMVNEVEGIERIRFMTSHPKDMSDELILAMKECDKVCKNLHLPFQSGSTEILKKMNRHYTTDEFAQKLQELKEKLPTLSITTDVIVGFPGETEEDFQTTYQWIQKMHFNQLHVFPYSPRRGTPAAKMKDQIDGPTKHQRVKALMDLSHQLQHEFALSQIGKTLEVLIEEPDGESMIGHASNYLKVKTNLPLNSVGHIYHVLIEECQDTILIGSVVSEKN